MLRCGADREGCKESGAVVQQEISEAGDHLHSENMEKIHSTVLIGGEEIDLGSKLEFTAGLWSLYLIRELLSIQMAFF